MARGGVEIIVVKNVVPQIPDKARAFVSAQVRIQGFTTEADMKTNITTMGLIDTGNMRATTAAHATGPYAVEVGPSVESANGFPYDVAQNFGTVRIPASPFASLAAEKAQTEFPQRFRGLEGAVS